MNAIVRQKEEVKNCAEVPRTKEHKDFYDQLTSDETLGGDTAQGRGRQSEQTDESTRDTLKEEGLALQRGKLLCSSEN